jgi:hypothetical protein
MISALRHSRWLIAPVLFFSTCSQGPAPLPTGSTAPGLTTYQAGPGNASGIVTGLAVGDVQNGPLEIFNVRVGPTGGNRFYANPGGVYRVDPGVSVEFWVEWKSAQALSTVPRLIINWGFTEADNIHCGPCLLNKAFPVGLHTVTVTLDDRVGGTTRRTFQIDTRPLPPEGTQITVAGEAFGHHGLCSGWNGCGNAATCALWACQIKGFSGLVSYGADKPCTQFSVCHLFNNQFSIQYNWGNWCDVRGVTDIVCR